MRLVYEVTGKFVPYEFIGALGHSVITDIKLGDQVEKIVTVLFSDIQRVHFAIRTNDARRKLQIRLFI